MVVLAVFVVRGISGTLEVAVGELAEGAEQVASAASQISSSSQSLAQGSSEQAASIEQTLGTIIAQQRHMRSFGERLRAGFSGWRAVVLAGSHRQAEIVGSPIKRDATLYNGTLACTAAFYDVGDGPAGAARVSEMVWHSTYTPPSLSSSRQ